MRPTLRPFRSAPALLALAAGVAAAGCASSPTSGMAHDHAAMGGMAGPAASSATAGVGAADLPADAGAATVRLNASPRHGEFVTVRSHGDSVRAWVVYPQRATRAPVVVVVHEIFGLTSWVRAVADQLAAEGFIAVAPDFLTDVPGVGNADTLSMQNGVRLVSALDLTQVQRRIGMAAEYATALPAARPQYGVVGFCWGGSVSFAHAIYAAGQSPGGPTDATLRASVVYYGTAPASAQLAREQVPILGLFGGNDARVTSTLPPADSTLRAIGRAHDFVIYPGAGHGFLRQQRDSSGANLAATRQAWPRTVAWFKQYLGA